MATFNTLNQALDAMGLDYNEESFGYSNSIEYGSEWVSKTGKTIYRCLEGFYHVNDAFLTDFFKEIAEMKKREAEWEAIKAATPQAEWVEVLVKNENPAYKDKRTFESVVGGCKMIIKQATAGTWGYEFYVDCVLKSKTNYVARGFNPVKALWGDLFREYSEAV